MKKTKSNSIINDLEFVGLAGFEEIDSYTLLREIKKKGELTVKKEETSDRKSSKKKEKKKTLIDSNVSTENVKSDNYATDPETAPHAAQLNEQRKRSSSPTSDSCEKELKKINRQAICSDAWRSIFTPEIVINSLEELGFNEPSSIQKSTIPAAIQGRKDIIGAAETGSGKTLAFVIPIIDGILKDRRIEKETKEGNAEDRASEFVSSGPDEENDGESEVLSHRSNKPTTESGSESDGESTYDLLTSGGCVKVIDDAKFDFMELQNSDFSSGPLRAVIITPTRELAIQVQKHAEAVLSKTDIKCVSVIGGLSLEKQERLLKKSPEIIIGTPGRLWEVFQQGNSHMSQLPGIRYLAIDETDRMLQRGHFEELKKLLQIINSDANAKKHRQTFIFSATLTLTHDPPSRQKMRKMKNISTEMKIENFARVIGIRKNPKIVDLTRKCGTAESLSEVKIFCDEDEKDGYLYYFLKCFPGRTLVFCNSINCVKRLSNLLRLLRCSPQTLHASKIQKQRLSSLEKFTRNSVSVLLATDVAARGIDIAGVDHILHYEVPKDAETYVHRSGRTARASKEGLSVLLVDNRELGRYKKLCATLNRSSDLPSFPIEQALIDQARERVNLANQIEKFDFVDKRKSSNKFWFKRMAEEAEIELSDSGNDDDDVCEIALKKRHDDAEQKNRRRVLGELLSQPMTRLHLSHRYPNESGAATIKNVHSASNNHALNLVKSGKNTLKLPISTMMKKSSNTRGKPERNVLEGVEGDFKKDARTLHSKKFNTRRKDASKRIARGKKKLVKSSSTK